MRGPDQDRAERAALDGLAHDLLVHGVDPPQLAQPGAGDLQAGDGGPLRHDAGAERVGRDRGQPGRAARAARDRAEPQAGQAEPFREAVGGQRGLGIQLSDQGVPVGEMAVGAVVDDQRVVVAGLRDDRLELVPPVRLPSGFSGSIR